MAIAELIDEKPDKIIFLSQLMERTGMTADQATLTFRWMVENGFCDGKLLPSDDSRGGKVSLTVKGMDEIEWLRLPLYRRMWTESSIQTMAIALIAGAVGGTIANIISGLVMKML
jgi:hypothetical protein